MTAPTEAPDDITPPELRDTSPLPGKKIHSKHDRLDNKQDDDCCRCCGPTFKG